MSEKRHAQPPSRPRRKRRNWTAVEEEILADGILKCVPIETIAMQLCKNGRRVISLKQHIHKMRNVVRQRVNALNLEEIKINIERLHKLLVLMRNGVPRSSAELRNLVIKYAQTDFLFLKCLSAALCDPKTKPFYAVEYIKAKYGYTYQQMIEALECQLHLYQMKHPSGYLPNKPKNCDVLHE